MGQIYAVVGSGVVFLAFCAYFETRDAFQPAHSAAPPISMARAKAAGMFAAGLTFGAGFVVCCLLAAAENSFYGAL
jgi:hypothetical protein